MKFWERNLPDADRTGFDFKNLMFGAIDQVLIEPLNERSVASRSARKDKIKHSVNQLFTNTEAGKYREDFQLSNVDEMKDIFNTLLDFKDYEKITDILLALEETEEFLYWDIKNNGQWKR